MFRPFARTNTVTEKRKRIPGFKEKKSYQNPFIPAKRKSAITPQKANRLR